MDHTLLLHNLIDNMLNSELHKMYQAWQQDNDNHVCDWYNFVLWSARWNNTSPDRIQEQLLTCNWFKKGNQ